MNFYADDNETLKMVKPDMLLWKQMITVDNYYNDYYLPLLAGWWLASIAVLLIGGSVSNKYSAAVIGMSHCSAQNFYLMIPVAFWAVQHMKWREFVTLIAEDDA